ncbi:MAG TPA: IS110 family transposase [Chitinophagaceae bacterium]|jgi:transposase
METKGFLGIDVSKGYADFLLLDAHKQVLEESFQLQDTEAGRHQLKALIEAWFSKGIEQLYCGLESTGGYENNWYFFLKQLGKENTVHTARLNARAVKAVSDASLKRTITDEVSAENIGVYLISFPEKVDYGKKQNQQSNEQFKEGRQHYSFIRMQQRQKVQLSNQLEKLLYQHFAELLIYCRHGIPGWLLRMLCKYSSAAAVLKAGTAKLSAIKGISADKAKALCEKAQQSTQNISPQVQHVIAATAKEIVHKEAILKEEKAYITAMYQENEAVKIVSSIPGIGTESAVAIMLEIEDITRFETVKKLTAYFGVHPKFKQSGDGTWGSHMSKQGRGEKRAVLYMAALTAIRCNAVLKQLYARLRAKGMKHYQAMGAVMHKLLRIVYGVLKNKTKFDAAIDEKNQQQALAKQKEKEEQKKENKKIIEHKKHRYQPVLNTEAPISRRTAQRRKKEQMAS